MSEVGRDVQTSIREIIIEDFMSYEYARIPLRPGLNIICGPNGSGKSSILLALSVALGQTYTERSRRLSDLIRYGRDNARVTVVFDNADKGGGRPIQGSRYDEFILSRYLNRDGTYWYEADHRSVTKEEVTRILTGMGINPDNMLIVMHQNMVDVFSALDAHEKLLMVEEAVGLRAYREKIMETRERLGQTLSEKDSIDNLLEKAQETLRHWQGEYERYLRKSRLLQEKKRLEAEYAWSRVRRQERVVDGIASKVELTRTAIEEASRELERCREEAERGRTGLERSDHDLEEAYLEVVLYQRELAERLARKKLIEAAERLSLRGRGPSEVLQLMAEEGGPFNPEVISGELAEYEAKVEEAKSMLAKLKARVPEDRERYVEARVKVALLEYKTEMLRIELSRLESDLRRERSLYAEMEQEARSVSFEVDTERSPQEILEEIRLKSAQLATLEDVSADAEKMYKSYLEMLEELRRKAEVAAENRRLALDELKTRTDRLRGILNELIGSVGSIYRGILNSIGADGGVRLVDIEDLDKAGVELLVGFKGDPKILDSYTHSGGERATAIMCFLLSLQKYIRSPIRAIDEFDIHMDPRNREMMMRQLYRIMSEGVEQYLVITPRELIDVEKAPNVITVQSLKGGSRVTVAV
ncbi:MAG: AAA family ATPase [Candidatus Bathyarchaeia archaeon]